jgi:CDGSH-type Zn-finger protein
MKPTQARTAPGITVAFDVLDDTGAEIGPAGCVALCRCGGTGNPPFCDGTHRTNGFRPRARTGG